MRQAPSLLLVASRPVMFGEPSISNMTMLRLRNAAPNVWYSPCGTMEH